ncbi:MAG: ABC transporter substrate-binding protein, partial [Actinomycetota bacterium]
MAGTPEAIDKNGKCLSKLVPIIQRSLADFLQSPERANSVIVDAVQKIQNGWVYTTGQAAASVQKQIEDGLIADGSDG